MFFYYKRSLAFALLFSLASVVHPQIHSVPSPTPPALPLPYISLRDCSVFQGYSRELMETCRAYRDNIFGDPAEGLIIINRARGTDISEAGANWLILADSSSGAILTSQAWPLRLNQDQYLIGDGMYSVQKTILSFSESSPAHLIHLQGIKASIRHLQLAGVLFGPDGALLYINKPQGVDITFNIFNTTPIKSTAIDINNNPGDNTSGESDPVYNSIGNNIFNLSASSRGVKVSLLHRKNNKVIILVNQFNLDGDSKGNHIVAGSFYSRGNKFIQTSPAPSRDQPPVAILFDPGPQAEDNHRLFHDSTVECSIFDGGRYGDLVPLCLADFFDSDKGHPNRITIAHNIFRNVSEVVRVAGSSPIITADSICNIWEPGDSDNTNRCPTTPPINGFLHFTDGETCGTRPDNFTEPDCQAERRKLCYRYWPLFFPTREPTRMSGLISETVATKAPPPNEMHHEKSSGSLDEATYSGAFIGAGAAGLGLIAVGCIMITYGTYRLIRRNKSKNMEAIKYSRI